MDTHLSKQHIQVGLKEIHYIHQNRCWRREGSGEQGWRVKGRTLKQREALPAQTKADMLRTEENE